MVNQLEDRGRMTPNCSRRAALSLFCAALVVAQAASAAKPKYTRLIPKSPNAQAMIAARNAAGKKLLGSQPGDWRRNLEFLKAISGPGSANPKVPSAPSTQDPEDVNQVGSDATAAKYLSGPARGSVGGTPLANVRPASGENAASKASSNFGGFMAAPSYQAIQYPQATNTAATGSSTH
jgi:hypothetical protein